MWYKVYADGTELDIIHALNSEEAIKIAKMRHGDGPLCVWTTRRYGG
jgi:hypothetical protein